jgi:membrane protein DedA with SNARE-associated domain
MGCLLWVVSAVFIGWAFGVHLEPTDWVQMHVGKLQAGVGIGLAGIGTLFICFAALISVVSRGQKD